MSGQIAIWLDGTQTSSLPLPDRGLDFGDGLFETFLVHKGIPLFPEYHLDRLALGLRALRLPDCLDTIRLQLLETARTAGQQGQWAVLRLSVLRGSGPRGYAPAASSSPRILIYVSNLDRDGAKMGSLAELGIVDIRLSAQPLLARIKHLNRLEQIMAAVQVQNEGTDEGVMLDQAGRLISVIAGNIFVVHNGALLTPRLDDCGVAGTRRRLIIERWAPSIGLNVQEANLSLSDLQVADEVFYSNSLQTVRPIARVAHQRWNNHNVCEALFQCYLEDISS